MTVSTPHSTPRPLTIMQMLPELNVGGVEQGVVDSALGYVARGHRSIVISNGGSRVDELVGSTHHTLPVHRKNLFTALRMISKVTAIIRNDGVDVVHARSRVPAWIGYFAARWAGVPFVTTVHGFYSPHAYSRIMSRGGRVIAVSNPIAEYAAGALRADPKNVRLVYRGTEPERFLPPLIGADRATARKQLGLPEDAFVVAIIGRITRLKGHLVFFDAVARVMAGRDDVYAFVVGSVPPSKVAYGKEINDRVASLGIADQTVFAGSRGDVPELLRALDLVVSCSTKPESFGRTVLEAMAVGLPVVASAHGGSLDLIADGENGYLVPPDDADAMAAAIQAVADLPDRGRAMGAAGRVRVAECFTLDRMVEQTIDVYRELLP